MGEAKERPPRKRLAIGIDPPRGLAAFNLDTKRFEKLMNVSFWDIIETLDLVREHYDIHVVCEAPQKNLPVWLGDPSRGGRTGSRALTKTATLMKAAQNVGQNKQCAMLIIEWCERHGIRITTQKPGRRSMTKLTAEEFNRITGWTGSSNEHTRDAGMLVYQQ